MQKKQILSEIKKSGFRITKQRKVVLDIIINEECTSCKEIISKASQVDKSIGAATVYRVINLLESIHVIDRKNMFKLERKKNKEIIWVEKEEYSVCLEDQSVFTLPAQIWGSVIKEGLKAHGYDVSQKIVSVM